MNCKTNTLYMYRVHCTVSMPTWFFGEFMRFLRDMQFDIMVVNVNRVRRVLFKGYGVFGSIAVYNPTVDEYIDDVRVYVSQIVDEICGEDEICRDVLYPYTKRTWIGNTEFIGIDIPELNNVLREMAINRVIDYFSQTNIVDLNRIIEDTLNEHPEKVDVKVDITEKNGRIDGKLTISTRIVVTDVILCMTVDSYGEFDHKGVKEQLLWMLFRYGSIDRELLRPM